MNGPGSSSVERCLRVGYVLKKYPRLSETFILNEVLGLEKMGHEVSIFSLNLPDEGRFHADTSRFRGSVIYLPQLKSDSVLAAFSLLRDRRSPLVENLDTTFHFLDLLPDRKRTTLLLQALHLAARVREQRIDHLHAHFMTVASWVACLTHLLTGVGFSVTAHAKDIFRNTVDGELFRLVASRASSLVTVSDYNRRYIVRRFLGGEDDKIVRIYNGIPFNEIALPSKEPRERDLILAVGRLVEKKGFPSLLEACRILRDRGRSFRCVIIGEGEDRSLLLEQRRRIGLEDRVELAGPQPREVVLESMRRARVLASPCKEGSDGNRDALPTVLLEALAVGLPPIGTRVTGIPEIIDHGINGLIVNECDEVALADALELLLSEDELWGKLSEAGPSTVKDRFDRDLTLPDLANVFDRSSRAVPVAGSVS